MGRRLRHVHAHRHALIAFALAACEQATPPRPPPPPTPVPVPVVPADATTVPSDADVLSACDVIAVELADAGTWVGSPPGVRCFAPKLAGDAYDHAWLKQTLGELRDALVPTCTPTVQVAAPPLLPYQKLVDALDVVAAVPLPAQMASGGPPMHFDPAIPAPRTCPAPTKVLRPIVLLRADALTPAHVITRVVETAKQAGFDNVLFAVKRP